MTLNLEIIVGIDAETARKEEEELMLRDANQWLNAGCYTEQPHPQTGAYGLHVAAAKGYIKVIKYVQVNTFQVLIGGGLTDWCLMVLVLTFIHSCVVTSSIRLDLVKDCRVCVEREVFLLMVILLSLIHI